MNLNFTEVNNLGNGDYFDVNDYQSNNNNSYWENPKATEQTKKVSYDDILNSLNLVVNKSGVLQYMSVNPNVDNQEPQHNQKQNNQKQNNQMKGKSLEPQVKNSYIFNKYFKDYKDTNIEDVKEAIERYRKRIRIFYALDTMEESFAKEIFGDRLI